MRFCSNWLRIDEVWALELKSARKSYDDVVVLHDLSLAVPAGCIYGLLGPNGAGKTTALRIMVGILMPDEGALSIFGEPFDRRHLKAIGYLPEERGLWRRAKVGELLQYLGELKGVPRTTIRHRIAELAERLSLDIALGRRIEELSKGTEQKIQLMAAMINDPQLLILDEPFAGLDPLSSARLVDLLLNLKQGGRTILFSSHRMDRVEKLCDEICLINHGTSALQGGVLELKVRFGRRQVRLVDRDALRRRDQNGSMATETDGLNGVAQPLGPQANAKALLRTMAAGATIVGYETVEPSLEEIFIEAVQDSHDL
jgi:ABC-2 type transport system ATP-binding protein